MANRSKPKSGRALSPANSRLESGSPPDPLPSSAPTWCKGAEVVSLPESQNNLSTPVGNDSKIFNVSGRNVTVNCSDSDGKSSLTTNAQHDLEDLIVARADHETYCSQLLTKKRGFPLWVPGPGMDLPIDYRRQGISIGDVGIITSDGEFDFLFNIFLPADDPINLGVTPPGFSPLSLPELLRGIRETIVYGPNTFLASSSVRKTTISETSVDQKFESTAKEAAILMIPEGSTTRDLRNTQGVRTAISNNASNWYTHARDSCGRDVKNGDIRVVVGIDKVSSWGIATSACTTGQTASYVFKQDPIYTYKWDCVGGSGRVGPQKIEIQDLVRDHIGVPQNQCIFVRTINFTLKGKTRSNLPSEAVKQSAGKVGGRGSGSRNKGKGRGGRGGSTNASSSSDQQPSSTQGTLHRTRSAVNIDPVEIGVNHPSAALHNRLHEKFPEADMIITGDMDWISVLNDDDTVFPESGELIERILDAHEVLDHDGIIQLLRKDDPNSSSMSKGKAKEMDVREGASYAGVSSSMGKVRSSRKRRLDDLGADDPDENRDSRPWALPRVSASPPLSAVNSNSYLPIVTKASDFGLDNSFLLPSVPPLTLTDYPLSGGYLDSTFVPHPYQAEYTDSGFVGLPYEPVSVPTWNHDFEYDIGTSDGKSLYSFSSEITPGVQPPLEEFAESRNNPTSETE